jgi:hypothetical protein
MIVDVLLPFALFLVGVTVVFLYSRLAKKVDHLVGGQELHLKHAIPLVLAIGVMATIVLALPEYALLGLFLFAYTAILFLFTYLFAPKWYFALVPSALFLLTFFYWWNIFSFNLFAVIFAISVAVYMGGLFTWKTTAVFAALVTVMDIIQVLITGHMGEAFETAKTLELPAFIQLPMFPTAGTTYLGLGDLFLFGLLSIQSTRKYGRRFGFTSITVMAVVYLLLQTLLLNYYPLANGFPATVLVISGWLLALAAKHLSNLFISKKQATLSQAI